MGCDQTCLNEAFGRGYDLWPENIIENILYNQCCDAFNIVSIDNVEYDRAIVPTE